MNMRDDIKRVLYFCISIFVGALVGFILNHVW